MAQVRDFFISHAGADLPCVHQIAWKLEAAGYTTILQDWDFQPGANFILEMDRGTRETKRTVALLSPRYLEALYTQPEWAARLVGDPKGAERRLVPVRIEECKPHGLLGPLVYIDLVGLDEADAREGLRERIASTIRGRSKPSRWTGSPRSWSSWPPTRSHPTPRSPRCSATPSSPQPTRP
jgi:hypothetical protein